MSKMHFLGTTLFLALSAQIIVSPDWQINLAQAQSQATTLEAQLQKLEHKDKEVRRDLIWKLIEQNDPEWVPILISAFQNKQIATGAAEALGELGDRAAVPALILALTNKRQETRQASAEALGKLGDKKAVPALIRALKESKHKTKQNKTNAL